MISGFISIGFRLELFNLHGGLTLYDVLTNNTQHLINGLGKLLSCGLLSFERQNASQQESSCNKVFSL